MTTKIKSGVIAAGAVDANALSDNSITIAHLNCSDGTNGQVLSTDGSGTLSFADGGVAGIVSSADATAITIDSSEKVGLNKVPSTWHLDVNSSDQYVASFDGSNDKGVIINSSTDSGDIIGYSNSTSTYNPLNIRGATGVGLYIDTSNKVGIGTDDPSVTLDVYNDSGWAGVDIDGTSGGEIKLQKAGTRYGGMYANDSTGFVIEAAAGLNTMLFYTNSAPRMRIDNLGDISFYEDTGTTAKLFWDASAERLGIGNNNPAETLTVNGDIGIGSSGKLFNGTSSNSAGIYLPNSTVRIDGYNGITFHSSSTTVGSQTERMRINSAGMLVLQEGNGLHTDTLRNDSISVGTTAVTVLDFSTAGSVGAARGFYLVTVIRVGASVGAHGVYLVGLSTASSIIIYETLRAATGFVASTSGANFQVSYSSTVTMNATAIPIGITGN